MEWRYITRGPRQYVMVRDGLVSKTSGDWVFVPRRALPVPLCPKTDQVPDDDTPFRRTWRVFPVPSP